MYYPDTKYRNTIQTIRIKVYITQCSKTTSKAWRYRSLDKHHYATSQENQIKNKPANATPLNVMLTTFPPLQINPPQGVAPQGLVTGDPRAVHDQSL